MQGASARCQGVPPGGWLSADAGLFWCGGRETGLCDTAGYRQQEGGIEPPGGPGAVESHVGTSGSDRRSGSPHALLSMGGIMGPNSRPAGAPASGAIHYG